MDKIKQELIEISKIVKEIYSLSNNEERIFKEINNLNNGKNKKHLEELKKEFLTMPKDLPVSYLRRLVLEKIISNEEVTNDYIEEKKLGLQKTKMTFKNWSNSRILMPFLITQDQVDEITSFFESIRNILLHEIDSFELLNYNYLIYDKSKCTFYNNTLIRFYNRAYKSLNKKKRLLFEIRPNGNIIFGLAITTGTASGLPEISPDDFDFNKMIQNFRDNIDQVLKDTSEKTRETQSNDTDELDNKEEEVNMHENVESINLEKYPLNQILYGPPGTGKTYSTVLLASNIIASLEGQKFSESDYDKALRLYRSSLGNQIEFITFHQNYSYEDFVQGLRPDLDNTESNLQFVKTDGLFKIIADRARNNLIDSQKDIKQLSQEELFYKAVDIFTHRISDVDEETLFKINESAYINAIDKDAFRFKWYNSQHHINGLRMKFKDLLVYYTNNITTRKDVLNYKEELSSLSVSHSTYYLIVTNEIRKVAKGINAKEFQPVRAKKKNYVLIIDEINRANISRVFGELITLVEPDKRLGNNYSMEVKLPLGDKFSVPNNLYIIGTMNTADKSIALLDIALRRRFEFVSMYPDYAIIGVKEVEFLKALNQRIIKTRGYDYQIGHSYFMGDNFNFLKVMNSKVIPLMQEYYMNNYQEVSKIISDTLFLIYDFKYKIAENIFPLQIVENENSQSL